MPKPYDDAMKKLVGGNPQDLISWILPGAQYGKQLPFELNAENIYADGLLLAMLEGKEFLAHFEFQSSYDGRIGERLLEYNMLASRQYNYLPVYSCVIYLKNHSSIPHSPLVRMLPNNEEVVRFHYRSSELGKLAAGELLETGLVGLLPLLPLTKDGARREVVEEMISGLISAEKTESLWIGYALASQVLKDDLNWLKRRFAMLEDILRDTPVYQEVLAKGEEKGRQEGKLEAQRQTLLDIVEERFPAISRMAKQQADTIQNPEILRRLTVKISVAKTSKEAEEYLLNPSSTENRH